MRRTLAAAAVAATGIVVVAPPAGAGTTAAAQGRSGCDVQVGGQRFDSGRRVELPSDRPADIEVVALDERPQYQVKLEVAGLRWIVGTGRGRSFGWERRLNIPDYAKYGVGAYRLQVKTFVDGRACTVTGRIDITERVPLTTVAGALAALAAILGSIGVIATLFRRGGRPLRTRHGFGVDDPLGEFVAVDTPGNYVGWAEVACDLGARRFVTTKPGADAVREFMREPKTHVRLSEITTRGVRIRAGADEHLMPRLKWRPRPFVLAPLFGVVAAVGILVYLQQAAMLYPTTATAIVAVLIGLAAGLLIANLARLFGTVALNRRLTAAEHGLDIEEVEPRYPPIDHLDELDTFVWTPTHTIPEDSDDGQPAWDEADRSKDPAATLDPGLQVRVVERRDGLAQVVCSNGWVGWTDAEHLEEIPS